MGQALPGQLPVRVTSPCQLDGALGCPGSWESTVSGRLCQAFLERLALNLWVTRWHCPVY